ncbi:hypothetical protein [Clostridium botulinum]|uniref:hypothetical protein n=1 Tax=Clostridium botulinum TaxID=1491 RepID=UPI00046600D7|nr:hypothetical protein [Clostridium botulinum]APR02403.1 hypothetical protein RSJ2_4083 [Clostridium botulinum]AUN01596.1 hypothetical protein RSJ19_01050 [Clostridium botulinum]MBN3359317.1 hypothetical protein [Clostridium botulinum]MBN3367143.1 hypothetical protein [Clostridium botulinum]MBN3376257.1 hypothetical protein [Clostridium botulinum]
MANLKTENGFEKSTNLVILEIKDKIIKTLDEANLPMTVHQMIINEIKDSIDRATRIQIEKDRIEYEDHLNSVEKNKTKGCEK